MQESSSSPGSEDSEEFNEKENAKDDSLLQVMRSPSPLSIEVFKALFLNNTMKDVGDNTTMEEMIELSSLNDLYFRRPVAYKERLLQRILYYREVFCDPESTRYFVQPGEVEYGGLGLFASKDIARGEFIPLFGFGTTSAALDFKAFPNAEKLERHIDEKEEMVLDINKLKTQRVIHASYDAGNITDYDSYREVVKSLDSMYPNLNHGSAEGLGRVAAELFGKMRGVDYKALKEIEKLNAAIETQGHTLGDLREKNDLKSRERSLVNKQQEDLYQG